MRVKTLWNYVPLPANLKLGYKRITATKLTTAYFLLAVAYCICQVVLQVQTFRLNKSSKVAISHIISEVGLPIVPFAHVEADGSLTLCTGFPTDTSNPCTMVFNAQKSTQKQANVIKPVSGSGKTKRETRSLGELLFRRDVDHVHAQANFTAPGVLGSIMVMGLLNEDDVTVIQPACATVLPFVDQSLHNAMREDMSFVFFNIWTMLVVVVAILNESIPHVIANQIALLLSVAWAGVQISRTMMFDKDFTRIVTNGSCNGTNLLPFYLPQRNVLLIAIVAVNALGVLLFGFFSFKLFNRFGQKSFERVGSNVPMRQAYILVLVFSICLQLLALLLTTSGALWLDELINGSIGQFSDHKIIYEATIITVLVILVPWLVTGWHCVRREKKKLTYAFIFVCLIVLGAHGALFASTTLRVTMANWTFFGLLGISSFAFLFLTLMLGVACWRNFNLGLSKCLEGQEILDGSEKVPWDFHSEKGGDPEKGSPSDSPNAFYARKTSESPDVPKMVLPNKAARRESILAKRNSGQNQAGSGAGVQRRVTFAERHNTIPLSPHPQTPESPYPFTHYHENPDSVPDHVDQVDSDEEEIVQSPEPWAGMPKVTAPVLMAPPPPRGLKAARNGRGGGGLPSGPGAARAAAARKDSADNRI